ncbi:MAG TPA: hypothetical protein VLF43_01425 [Candidatus Saccharimonadales bacterium]|nr:hypothetical protein [Candidatus Saccharimonadales bacterium]
MVSVGESAGSPGPEAGSEAAEAINSSINMVGYAVAHGGELDDRFAGLAAVEKEYDAVASVVNGLDPSRGDILFLEGDAANYAPFQWQSDVTTPETKISALNYMRATRLISVFNYAFQLAHVKGVEVGFPDIQRPELEQFALGIGETDINEVLKKGNDPSWAHFNAFHTRREQRVALSERNRALAALPNLGAEKPTYATLFGFDHFAEKEAAGERTTQTPGLTEAFNYLGLDLEVRTMPHAVRERRLRYIAELTRWLPTFPGAPASLRTEAQGKPIEPSTLMTHPQQLNVYGQTPPENPVRP